MRAFLDHLVSVGRAFVAMFAALLPRWRWPAFPRLPIEAASGWSGLATAAAGAIIGGIGYMRYVRRVADGAITATFRIADRQVRNEIPGEITTFATQTVSALSLVAFVLFTPLGLCSLYLVLTGVFRAVAVTVDDAFGDPLLSGTDALVSRSTRRARRIRARRARQREEGREVPDQLLRADAASVAGFDYVVVSSRQKPGWSAGTFVITSDKWYTLGEPFEVRLPEGLRTVYPLREQKVAEVLRRGVQYELPPLEPSTARIRFGQPRRTDGPGVSRD